LVARSARQQRQAAFELGQQRWQRQQADARGRQFDRQGQAVEFVANGRDRIDVRFGDGEVALGRRGAFDEQPNGLGRGRTVRVGRRTGRRTGRRQRERWHGHGVLAGNAQDGSARDEGCEGRAGGQEVDDQRPRVEDVLEVVQDQQHPTLPQRLADAPLDRPPAGLPDVERSGDGRTDQGRIADRGEGHEPDAVGEGIGHFLGDAERESGLADAAGTGEGQQANVGATHQVGDRGDFPLPTDEAGERDRQERLGASPARKRDRGYRLNAAAVGGRRLGHDETCD
jgi:hypothetical protein